MQTVLLFLQEIVNLSELTEQIDALRDNMTFIQDNINECQTAIVHMEEFKVLVGFVAHYNSSVSD